MVKNDTKTLKEMENDSELVHETICLFLDGVDSLQMEIIDDNKVKFITSNNLSITIDDKFKDMISEIFKGVVFDTLVDNVHKHEDYKEKYTGEDKDPYVYYTNNIEVDNLGLPHTKTKLNITDGFTIYYPKHFNRFFMNELPKDMRRYISGIMTNASRNNVTTGVKSKTLETSFAAIFRSVANIDFTKINFMSLIDTRNCININRTDPASSELVPKDHRGLCEMLLKNYISLYKISAIDEDIALRDIDDMKLGNDDECKIFHDTLTRLHLIFSEFFIRRFINCAEAQWIICVPNVMIECNEDHFDESVIIKRMNSIINP